MTATGSTWSPTARAPPELQESIRDPARFPWHEVTKVQHYWLSADALTQPMQVREKEQRYGEDGKS